VTLTPHPLLMPRSLELFLYSAYGPYGLYRASVPVQGCTFIARAVTTALQLIPVAARSKAWVCDRSLAVFAASNPAGGMDVFLVTVVLSGRVLCDLSTGVLLCAVCMSVISKPQQGGGLGH